jgi:hexosaminidase
MKSTVILLALVAGAGQIAQAAEPALMPMPVKMTAGSGKLIIDANFVVDPGSANPRLTPVVREFLARISRQTGVPFSPQPPAPADARRLAIQCAGGPAYPTLGEDESYTLDVSENEAHLKSATVEGTIHGLATFAQLIQPGPDGFQVAGVHIEDHPRYQWRGLMLDVCRHWMPVEVVERNLDAMAAVKLNVLHWHLSEDQGFRVESKKYPKLQGMGSDGAFYTQAQIRDVVEYARDRGIRVVPEFDVPGHTGGWFEGYPELASAPGPFVLNGRGSGSSAMDPTKETTYTFLDGFIGEMAALFPDPYWHVGGDEVSARAWTSNDAIVAYMKAHNFANAPALQVYFNQRLLAIVQKHGKTMLGWDEILFPGLPKDAVIHAWRNHQSLFDAAAQGYRGIMSWGYYLDHISPASYYYGNDPLSGPGSEKLTPEQAARIMGGEACMWSEMVGPPSVDSRVWPTTAAIAERLWSPKEVADVDSMYARLAVVSRNLEFTGVLHRANYQPMLDRLAGDQPSGPLKVVADAVEACGFGTGRNGRPAVWAPLNRFVDAVPPESELARSMEQAAKRFVANPAGDKEDAAMLRVQFQIWAANDAKFQALAGDNALLNEVKPVSKDLSALGVAGLRMLDYLTANQPAPADWLTAENTELTRLSRPPRPNRPLAAAPQPPGATAAPPAPPPAPVPTADVLLAAFRPVKVLADGLGKK